jgi:MFS transporter, UMF1 family
MRNKNKELFSWAVYDFGNSAFSTIIQTFIFAVYFSQHLVPDSYNGEAMWGVLNGLASLAIVLLAPTLGAIADQGGNRKSWLGFFTAVCILCTALLWFSSPESGFLLLIAALTVAAIACSELAFVFYNAMLPSLAPPSHLGRWSGWSWGFGYIGGLLSLAISLALIQAGYTVHATFLFCALWYLIFSLPVFIIAPSTYGLNKPPRRAIKDGLKALKNTIKQVAKYKDIVQFLIAHMLYIDALTTLFAFGGVFAASEFNMNQSEVLLFGILLNISAGLGTLALAWVDDLIGPKKLILISLVGITLPTIFLLTTTTAFSFWILGMLGGLFIGPLQSASRSFMSHLAPEDLFNEMFGFYSFSGKATSIIGPWLVSFLIFQFNSLRIGLSIVVAFFIIGGIIMLFVQPKIRR